MKKILIASLISLAAASSASALELSVHGTRDYSGSADRNGAGVALTHNYGRVFATAGFDRTTKGANDQDRYSLGGGVNVLKIANADVSVKTGVSYLENSFGADGYALTVGTGVRVPVTKTVAVGVDFSRQYGQDRVKSFDGNRVTVGLNYRF